MPVGEVVDPTKDPANNLRRLFLRIGVPIIGVILVVIVVVGVTLNSYRTTKAGILNMTHVILKTEQSRIFQEVLSYLQPATEGSNLIVDMLSHIPTEYKNGMFYTYATSSIRQINQVQSYYLADSSGQFMIVERADDNSDHIITITLKPDEHGGKFLIEESDGEGKKISHKYIDANAYDPTARGWYQDAIKNNGLAWTKPRLMPSRKGLIITASMPFTDRDGKKGVMAVNISLQDLTTFLTSLHVSKNAQVVVADHQGNMIVSRNMLLKFGAKNWNPDDNKINSGEDPVLTRAYDQYLVNGAGIRSFKLGKKDIKSVVQDSNNQENLKENQNHKSSDVYNKEQWAGRYISISAQLPDFVQKWVVLIVIPESDFSGFVVKGGKQNLLFSLLVVALATIMAGFLIYQGHRMDRLWKRFKYIKNISDQESDAIERIASQPDVFDPTNEGLMLTEGLCNLVAAQRVSIWHFAQKGNALICNDVYSHEDGNHAGGLQFSHSEIPSFFELLKDEEIIEIMDVKSDPRTEQLYRVFMGSVSTHSLMVVPVLGKDGVIGAVLIEDSPHFKQIHHIAKIFAGLVAMRFVAASVQFDSLEHMESENSHQKTSVDHIQSQNLDISEVQDELSDNSVQSRSSYLIKPGEARYNNHIKFETQNSNEQQGLYPAVAVMDIAFSGYLTSDIDKALELTDTVKDLVIVLQDIAHKYGLFYVKMMGGHLTAVAGCTKEPDITAPIRLAHAALDMRAACIEMIPAFNIDSNFGIGIDVGPAIGSWLGKDPKLFNLWGPTVGMSSLISNMAKEGGTIQVTQNAYMSLRKDFLFRPRGNFFIPNIGLSHMFILAGRR